MLIVTRPLPPYYHNQPAPVAEIQGSESVLLQPAWLCCAIRFKRVRLLVRAALQDFAAVEF